MAFSSLNRDGTQHSGKSGLKNKSCRMMLPLLSRLAIGIFLPIIILIVLLQCEHVQDRP